MKESNQNSFDPEDDTDLEIEGIENAIHLETKNVESTEGLELRSRLSRSTEEDTELEIDDIEDKVNIELESVDLLLEQGSQDRIDVVLERRSQNRDNHDSEDHRSHV